MDTTIQREISFTRFVALATWFDPGHGEKYVYFVQGVGLPSRYDRWADLTEYHPVKENRVSVRVAIEPNAAFTIRRTEFEELLTLMGFGEVVPETVNKRVTLEDLK